MLAAVFGCRVDEIVFRNRHTPRLVGMLVLPVATSGANESPAVSLDDPDDLPEPSSGMIVAMGDEPGNMAESDIAARDKW